MHPKPTTPRRGRRQRPDLQDYRNRDACYHLLDDRVFDALNDHRLDPDGTNTVGMVLAGCLDALDDIPAGSMVDRSGHWGLMYDCSYVERGTTLAERRERDAFLDAMIDDIRAEEAAA